MASKTIAGIISSKAQEDIVVPLASGIRNGVSVIDHRRNIDPSI